MKKIVMLVLACVLALAPAAAQSKRDVKQAKTDAKLLAGKFKSEGYKSLDNVKLDDAVNSYVTAMYSDKSLFEAVGKATSKDLNQAKADARTEALASYPASAVSQSFFVYKKNRKNFDVVCYALISGVPAANVKPSQYSSSTFLASAKAEQQEKEAKAEAKKAEQKAKKDAKKAQKQAEKKAAKERQKAEKAHQKAVEKANKKAEKAIEKADAKRADALKNI